MTEEFKKYNEKFKKLIEKYCKENNLELQPNNIYSNYQMEFVPGSNKNLTTFEDFKLREFTFFNSKGFSSYEIKLNRIPQKISHFMNYMKEGLDARGNELFNKFIVKSHRFEMPLLTANINDDEKLVILSHGNYDTKPYGGKNEFIRIFPILRKINIDSDERFSYLNSLFRDFKPIIKRTDTIDKVCEFVREKVDKKYHEKIEKLINTSVAVKKNASCPEDILDNTEASQIFKLKKSSFFQKMSFNHARKKETLEVRDLNYFCLSIFNCMDQEIKNLLGIKQIDFIEFNAKSEYSRVIIEYTKKEHRKDMDQILFDIIKTCSEYYVDHRTDFKNIIKTTVNSYLLNLSLDENLDKKLDKSTFKKKI